MTAAALLVGLVAMWMAFRHDEGRQDMGKIGIVAPYSAPVLVDDVRKALVASADLVVVMRMRRAGWVVETDGRRVTGKRFSAKGG